MQDDLNPIELGRIEKTTQELGRYLFARLGRHRPKIFERRWWDDRLMQWAMRDERVKVEMFRFIDVLPMLGSDAAIVHHLDNYFRPVRPSLPIAARWGLALARPGSAVGRFAAEAVRHNAAGNARRFIAGENLTEVLAAARAQRKLRRAFTLDLLGEAVISDVEAERYFRAYLDLIAGIAPVVNAWPEVPQIDRSLLVEIPRVNVSVKLSALDSQFDAIDPQGAARRVSERLRALLRQARAHRAHLHVDMESYATKDLTLAIFKQVLGEDEFRGFVDVGIVIQCYLRDSGRDLVALRDWARQRGNPIWVRLVKGAYWDYETVHAISEDWPIPVYQHKAETDANYERQTRFLMCNAEWLRPAIASHNLRSLAHAIAVARHRSVPQTAFELQMLYGMADSEKQALVNDGYRLRIYMPFGQLIPGMAYLVRRLLENTSNDSFLRASFSDHVPVEKLLMNPLHHTPPGAGQTNGRSEANVASGPFALTFRNEPVSDFARLRIPRCHAAGPGNDQAALGKSGFSLDRWRCAHSGRRARLKISAPAEPRIIVSLNPSHKRSVVGRVAAVTAEEAALAVAAAKRSGPAWAAIGARRGPSFFAERPERCAAGAMSSRPGRSSNAVRGGAKPTPMYARRSTSASSMPSRPKSSIVPMGSIFRARRIDSNSGRAAWWR